MTISIKAPDEATGFRLIGLAGGQGKCHRLGSIPCPMEYVWSYFCYVLNATKIQPCPCQGLGSGGVGWGVAPPV